MNAGPVSPAMAAWRAFEVLGLGVSERVVEVSADGRPSLSLWFADPEALQTTADYFGLSVRPFGPERQNQAACGWGDLDGTRVLLDLIFSARNATPTASPQEAPQ